MHVCKFSPSLSLSLSFVVVVTKRPKIDFRDQLSLTAGQKYCRILSTFIKVDLFLSFFEWPLKAGFTVVDVVYVCFLFFSKGSLYFI